MRVTMQSEANSSLVSTEEPALAGNSKKYRRKSGIMEKYLYVSVIMAARTGYFL